MNRRTAVFLALIAALVFVRGCPRSVFITSHSFQARLLDLHNKERRSKGEGDLRMSPELNSYAQKWAEMMAKRNSLKHSSMSDLSVAAGTSNVAENIAWGQDAEEEVLDTWMHSTGHRRNILGNYTEAGFGMAKDKDGRPYWCVVFSKKEKNG